MGEEPAIYGNRYTPNDELVQMKTEDITQQFVDRRGIYNRRIYSDEMQGFKAVIGSDKMEMIKADPQEIDNSISSRYNSNQEVVSYHSRNFKEESCEYSTENHEEVGMKVEHLDMTEQFVDENGIYDREIYSDEIDDFKSHIAPDQTEEQEIVNSTNNKNNSNEENSINCKDISCDFSSENVEEVEKKTENSDIMEQLLNENGIYDREIYLDGIEDLRSDTGSGKTEQQEIDNLTNNKNTSNEENSINCEDVAYDNRSVLKNKSSSKGRRHNCHICSYSSKCESSLKNHLDSVHSDSKQHKCQSCDYTSRTKGTLNRHINSVHLNLKQQKCHLCDSAANVKRSLKNHIDSVHLNLKQHNCHSCEYATNNKSDLKKHMESVHLNLKKHNCHLCEYASNIKNHLKSHVESVHLDSKLNQCHLCDYSANYKSNLKSHIDSVHLNVKNNECHLCDYVSYKKYDLKRHMQCVHLKLKKYKCHLCDYGANNKNYLRSHIDSVHLNLKKHGCHLCDYASYKKGHLKRHVDSIHLTLKNSSILT